MRLRPRDRRSGPSRCRRAAAPSRGEDAEGLKLAQPVRQAGGKEQSADDRGEEYKNNEVVELERAAEGGERERSKLGSRLGSGRLDGWGSAWGEVEMSD